MEDRPPLGVLDRSDIVAHQLEGAPKMLSLGQLLAGRDNDRFDVLRVPTEFHRADLLVGGDVMLARTVGATEARVRFDVTLPLIRNGILAGWVLIFLIFVREYSTGVYLLAPGTQVIGSLLVSLWGKGAMDLVSALSVVNVGMIGAGLLIANRLGLHLHG